MPSLAVTTTAAPSTELRLASDGVIAGGWTGALRLSWAMELAPRPEGTVTLTLVDWEIDATTTVGLPGMIGMLTGVAVLAGVGVAV